MNAGQDEKLIKVHSRAMDYINQELIKLQDETVKRMNDALEAAEARAEQLAAQLATAQARLDTAIKALKEIEVRTTHLDKGVNSAGDKQIASAWDIAYEALKAVQP